VKSAIRDSFRSRTICPLLLVLFLVALTSVAGCKPSHRERPYGYLRLGLVKDLLAKETFLSEDRLMLRHDSEGFFVMSTLCAHDLTPLNPEQRDDGEKVWTTKYNASVYSEYGKVVTGPAVRPLPYFELKLDSGTYGGPQDTLYVYIGVEKDLKWRLKVAG